MAGKFTRKTLSFAERASLRITAVHRTAALEVANRANRPRAKGGRMRVDTGFLRASIAAAVGRMPTGEAKNPYKQANAVQVNEGALAAVLLTWQPRQELYIGWTASYAVPREARDGFLAGAVEQWDEIVEKAVKRVRKSGL